MMVRLGQDTSRTRWRAIGTVATCLLIASISLYLFGALDTIRRLSGPVSNHDSSPTTNLEHDETTTAATSTQATTTAFTPEDLRRMERMIVAAHYHENVQWTEYIRDIPVTLVEKDNPDNPDNVGSNNMTESTSYLYYMIKYYDSLPDVVAFVHGHGDPRILDESVWTTNQYQALPHPETMETCNTQHETEGGHLVWLGEAQPVPLWPGDAMKALDDSEYQQAYHTLFNFLRLGWEEGGMGMEIPHYITTLCCSAFSVNRDTIRRVPKDRLIRLFEFLESGINRHMGVTMEYVWTVLFNIEKWD